MTNMVYNQQLRYLQNTNRYICPHDAFRKDLASVISSTICNNTDLILCIDINENVKDRKLQHLFSLFNLIEALAQYFS